MELAMLCGFFPSELEKCIISNSIGRIDYAANNFQKSFIAGLDKCNNNPVKIFNSLYIGTYPYGYKKIFIQTSEFSHILNSNDLNIGFINFPVVKEVHKFLNIFLNLNKWVRSSSEKKVLVIYALYTPFLLPILFLKKLNKNVKTCIIIPDLPEYMSDNKNIFRLFFKYLNNKLIYRLVKSIDSYVVLTDFVVSKLGIENKPCVRIEGIYNSELENTNKLETTRDLKIIMYSGNLDQSQGIIDLLKAFSIIKHPDYRLWFTGHGDSLIEIQNQSKQDFRIKYLGRLSHKELLEKQAESTILINPLSAKHPKVKYFFPSKTMEYLASGRPTLMHKLPCIPKEYYPHIIFFKDEKIESLKDLIFEVCNKSELELSEFGFKAKEFIKHKKNPVSQCSKLYQMLLNL